MRPEINNCWKQKAGGKAVATADFPDQSGHAEGQGWPPMWQFLLTSMALSLLSGEVSLLEGLMSHLCHSCRDEPLLWSLWCHYKVMYFSLSLVLWVVIDRCVWKMLFILKKLLALFCCLKLSWCSLYFAPKLTLRAEWLGKRSVAVNWDLWDYWGVLCQQIVQNKA